MGDDLVSEIDHAHEIGIHCALPLLDSGREKALGGRASGVGDADVGTAEFLYHGVDEIADGGRVGHIERFGKDFCLVLAANLFRSRIESFAIACAHGDAAAFGGKGFGCGPANPLTGRSHDGDSVFESGFQDEFG